MTKMLKNSILSQSVSTLLSPIVARVCLIFTLFILTNCKTNCSTTAKYWKNMALKKNKKAFQSYSFGDQQLTEPLLQRHIHSLIYFNNTFNYGNGLSHRVDKQRL